MTYGVANIHGNEDLNPQPCVVNPNNLLPKQAHYAKTTKKKREHPYKT